MRVVPLPPHVKLVPLLRRSAHVHFCAGMSRTLKLHRAFSSTAGSSAGFSGQGLLREACSWVCALERTELPPAQPSRHGDLGSRSGHLELPGVGLDGQACMRSSVSHDPGRRRDGGWGRSLHLGQSPWELTQHLSSQSLTALSLGSGGVLQWLPHPAGVFVGIFE